MWPDIFESKAGMLSSEKKCMDVKINILIAIYFLKNNAIIYNYDFKLSGLIRMMNP